MAGNWNALVDAAAGEFLVIIGDDDRLLPEFVEKLMKLIQPKTQVAFSNHYLIDVHGNRLINESNEVAKYYQRADLPIGKVEDVHACVWQNSVPLSASLLRTETVRRLRFKEDLNTPEIELFARLAQEGGEFVFTPEFLSEYRTHEGSLTASGLRGESLVKYLTPIRVPSEAEPYKREFMAQLLVNSVSRCLISGDHEMAQSLVKNEYYPRLWRGKSISIDRHQNVSTPEPKAAKSNSNGKRRAAVRSDLKAVIQRLCTLMPATLGCTTYRLIQRARTI